MIAESFLELLGIEVSSELEDGYQVFCPFHDNTNTPAMYIDRERGLFNCFSADCGESGNLLQLVVKIRGGSIDNLGDRYSAQMFIDRHVSEESIESKIKRYRAQELTIYDQDELDQLHANFPFSRGHEYMASRGFTSDTLKYFKVGYEDRRSIVTVPMYDDWGRPLGYVGRATWDKVFINSHKLPSKRAVWNLHNARMSGARKLILTEASFDAMRIHQAGFPNVGALLKGSISKFQVDLIEKYFKEVIMFADNEPNGIKLGNSVHDKLHIPMRWCNLENYNGLKDASDMLDEQIFRVLSDVITHSKMQDYLELAG